VARERRLIAAPTARTRSRLALVGALLVAVASSAAGETCAPARIDMTDWALIRSAAVPGFTLRLPRAFVRDSAEPPLAARVRKAPTASWADASRGRLALMRTSGDSSAHVPLGSDGRVAYQRCEERVGSAVAIIVSYDTASGNADGPFVLHACIRWPDGEDLDVRGDAPDRARLEQMLAAVRSIRRAGA
jgi:hypothetical protein